MKILLIALSLGFLSMIIVFISGMTSGVVRLGTIAWRTFFSFCMTSAATYFLMMAFDLYQELKAKKLQKLKEEIEKAENPAVDSDAAVAEAAAGTESENAEQPPPAEGFQPIDVNNLPNVGK